LEVLWHGNYNNYFLLKLMIFFRLNLIHTFATSTLDETS
jgi:hypothetical protein